jgi:hypothetical protein
MPEADAVIGQLLQIGRVDLAAKRCAVGIPHVVYHNEQEIWLPLVAHALRSLKVKKRFSWSSGAKIIETAVLK